MDIESEFNSIVEQLDMEDFTDPRGHVTVWEINRAVMGMNQASSHLGNVLSQVLKEGTTIFPANLTPVLREIIKLTDAITDGLSECHCPDCELGDCPQCEASEDGICAECASLFEVDEEDEDK